jgi:hypothetical protein
MKHNRLEIETKTGMMLASDREMAPQVLVTPRDPAHRQKREALWTPRGRSTTS